MSEMIMTRPGDLLAYLQKHKSSVEMALPSHLKPDRMLRLAVTCFSQNRALRNCKPETILASIIVASQIGLEPGIVGQGYLIPYMDTCTFVPGWQGLVGLLNNSGRATAWTGSVFEGDEFRVSLGSNPSLHHAPGPNFGDQDKLTHVYAVGKVNGSEIPVIEAWPIVRIWKHRDRFNKVGDKHYSFSHPEMYARKVVLLQVLKYMPRSIELSNALVANEAADTGKTSVVDNGIVVPVDIEVEPEPVPTEPKTGPAAPTVKPEPRSANTDLAALMESQGITFNALQRWAAETGTIANADSIASFAEIPQQDAARVLTALNSKKTGPAILEQMRSLL